MLDKLYNSESEKQILFNFCKLFMPYKNAVEIQEEDKMEMYVRGICQQWGDVGDCGDGRGQQGDGEGVEGEEGGERYTRSNIGVQNIHIDAQA